MNNLSDRKGSPQAFFLDAPTRRVVAVAQLRLFFAQMKRGIRIPRASLLRFLRFCTAIFLLGVRR